jgi:hypothetical protein
MKTENKTYTANDFANYHAGKMPVQEMYALEKAALEDPFLADALEGYVFTNNAAKDIAEIKGGLNEKRKNRKLFFLSPSVNNSWWRIAAAMLIIIGVGIVFYNVNKKDAPVEIAETVPTVKKGNNAINQDDTDIRDNGIAKNESADLIKQDKNIAVPKTDKIESIVQNDISTSAAQTYTKDDADKKFVVARKESANAKHYTLKGTVKDGAGEPVAFATIEDKSSNRATSTDSLGRFTFNAYDSSINVTASALGYFSKSFSLNQSADKNIKLEKLPSQELSEVVATAPEVKKSMRSSGYAVTQLNGKVAGVQINADSIYPSVGGIKYDAYLKQKTAAISDSITNAPSGEVTLSFSINKKGVPKNIKVISSTCPVCNDEAIKILKEGPRWVGKKGIKHTLLIKF